MKQILKPRIRAEIVEAGIHFEKLPTPSNKKNDLGPAISIQEYLTIGDNSLQIPWQYLLDGIWDRNNQYTSYILNNVCQSTVCD